ncbi:hypothetical protein B0T17DRAFT_324947 [Bombardia bombarda]|uniref:Uncharacterized protein n=1 Tax=Bombardia bombarda TaxID=252184 RepID=A0AA39WMH9_9PEZI|nr:hypothetical protein B0T17DRAFT_324947 [Bombardia bombarda]
MANRTTASDRHASRVARLLLSAWLQAGGHLPGARRYRPILCPSCASSATISSLAEHLSGHFHQLGLPNPSLFQSFESLGAYLLPYVAILLHLHPCIFGLVIVVQAPTVSTKSGTTWARTCQIVRPTASEQARAPSTALRDACVSVALLFLSGCTSSLPYLSAWCIR